MIVFMGEEGQDSHTNRTFYMARLILVSETVQNLISKTAVPTTLCKFFVSTAVYSCRYQLISVSYVEQTKFFPHAIKPGLHWLI